MFSKFLSGSVDYLVIGLGNPGLKYEKTRHNAGFIAVDYMADKLGGSSRSKSKGEYFSTTISGKKVILLKPMTYMNLSGICVADFMKFYKMDSSKIIVISDDITLPIGRMRIRKKGSHGGHNGLRDISARIGTDDYVRIKVGVGEKPHPEMDLADWVTSKFTPKEFDELKEVSDKVYGAVSDIIDGNIDRAMNKYN